MKILCLEINYVGFKNSKWKQFALDGNRLQAIKALWESRPTGKRNLMQAKIEVDNFMAKNGVCKYHPKGETHEP